MWCPLIFCLLYLKCICGVVQLRFSWLYRFYLSSIRIDSFRDHTISIELTLLNQPWWDLGCVNMDVFSLATFGDIENRGFACLQPYYSSVQICCAMLLRLCWYLNVVYACIKNNYCLWGKYSPHFNAFRLCNGTNICIGLCSRFTSFFESHWLVIFHALHDLYVTFYLAGR
jgi:hypothetical protein